MQHFLHIKVGRQVLLYTGKAHLNWKDQSKTCAGSVPLAHVQDAMKYLELLLTGCHLSSAQSTRSYVLHCKSVQLSRFLLTFEKFIDVLHTVNDWWTWHQQFPFNPWFSENLLYTAFINPGTVLHSGLFFSYMIASTSHYAYEIVHYVWLTKIPPLTSNQSDI